MCKRGGLVLKYFFSQVFPRICWYIGVKLKEIVLHLNSCYLSLLSAVTDFFFPFFFWITLIEWQEFKHWTFNGALVQILWHVYIGQYAVKTIDLYSCLARAPHLFLSPSTPVTSRTPPVAGVPSPDRLSSSWGNALQRWFRTSFPLDLKDTSMLYCVGQCEEFTFFWKKN